MRRLPLFFDLSGRRVLVVGGGAAALAKVRLLAAVGARMRVVAPRIDDAILQVADDLILTWRGFRPADLHGAILAVSATGLAAVDEAVAAAARAAGVPVNVVDRPELCDVVVPAIVDRGEVVVAISTGGAAPVLARRLRGAIEALLPARIGRLAAFAAMFRDTVTARLPAADRRRFWEGVLEGPVGEAVLAGREDEAREAMLRAVNDGARGHDRGGIVHLVGAGPGDPDLLTLKALRLLQAADVIVHDALVGPAILDLARRDAERIDAGKRRGRQAMSQPAINALLAARARAGQRVVRLKGGDPLVFGRGGEELAYLRANGVAVELVPGITAATACAAAAGIPLTERGVADGVRLVSGHRAGGPREKTYPVPNRETVVVYMGVATAAETAAGLIAEGHAPSAPVAVIENGTLPGQRVLRGRLDGLGVLMSSHGVRGPALTIIGEVAAVSGEAAARLAEAS